MLSDGTMQDLSPEDELVNIDKEIDKLLMEE